MAKQRKGMGSSLRVSATILMFSFWVTFVMLYTLFFSPALEHLQNFLIMFTSLLLFALGTVYIWSPALDKFTSFSKPKKAKRKMGTKVKRRRKRR